MLNIIHNSTIMVKIIKNNNNKNNRNDKMKHKIIKKKKKLQERRLEDHCSFKKYIRVQITVYYYKNCRNYHCI